MGVDLYSHQVEAVEKMHNGCILCGGIGTGKSRTALAYFYFKECGAKNVINKQGSPGPLKAPRDLYIITTAKKRDSGEWIKECGVFDITSNSELNPNNIQLTIDSWNNIKKYRNVVGAFFIFDEQRVVGSGAWVRSFLKIARKNRWILLSATPGDVWTDYAPVFVANGFYKNRTEFLQRHAVYSPYTNFPKIDKYTDTGYLVRLRNKVLVHMHYEKVAKKINHVVNVDHDREKYKKIFRDRWDPWEDEPIKDPGKLCYLLRRCVNEDQSRIDATTDLILMANKAIIFYNFNYELQILRSICETNGIVFAEWNGEKHEEVPTGERWVYLVQYSAGAEGWNCTDTDTVIFYSQNYSYRMTVQAAGRIDRINTSYKELHYYYIRSMAPIDIAIKQALNNKRNFNERSFLISSASLKKHSI